MGQCSTANKEDISENQNLTPVETTLLKNSWKIIVKQGLQHNGTNMMIRIFLEHKELKPLWRFARNLETQDQMNGNQLLKLHGEKLFNAIDMVVNNLDEWNTLTIILIQLGFSHYKWGVREHHFPTIGEALMGQLQDSMGVEYTDKVKKSWLKLLSLLVVQMKIGMKQAEESEAKSVQTSNTNLNNQNNVDTALLK